MVAKGFVFKILPTLSILFAVAFSGSSGRGVLSKLYQKAVNEHRPLILVLDSDNGPLHKSLAVTKPYKPKHVHKHVKAKSSLGIVAEDSVGDDSVLVRKITALAQNADSFARGKKQKVQKGALRTKEQLVGPLIKSLLRVSNDMNCVAKAECVEQGKEKEVCEEKFECEEERQDKKEEDKDKQDKQVDCALDDVDECGDDAEMVSTKGYTLEPEDNTCTRC